MEYKNLECLRHGVVRHKYEKQGNNRYRWRCCTCSQKRQTKSVRAKKQTLAEWAGGSCTICGYDYYQGSLEFHHIDPEGKSVKVSNASLGLARAMEEASKCVLLCSNCHKEVEAGKTSLPCPKEANMQFNGEYTFFEFADSWNDAEHLYDIAMEKHDGWARVANASVTACAFAVEACMNHIGETYIPKGWGERISWSKKIRVMESFLGFKFDDSVRPFSTIKEIHDWRDRKAHGRTCTGPINEPLHVAKAAPPWSYKYHDESVLKTALDDTKSFMMMMLKAAGEEPYSIYRTSSGHAWGS